MKWKKQKEKIENILFFFNPVLVRRPPGSDAFDSSLSYFLDEINKTIFHY